MPIRMTDDPVDPNQPDDDGGGGRRRNFPGGDGGIMSLLPMLLGLFKGRGIFLLLILGAGAFFLFHSGICTPAFVQKLFSESGYNFDPAQFDKASVYEGQGNDAGKNPLPEAVSLLRFAPQRGNQGHQGSCVAWSSAYGARTILDAASVGVDPDQIKFSPSFLYNQLNQLISRSSQADYLGKVNEALESILIRSARFDNTNDGTIYFKVDANDNKAVACVVAIDKQ